METIVCGRWNRHSSDYEETKNLRRTRGRFDAKLASQEELATAQDAVSKLLMNQLNEANVAVVGDGCIRWDSIFDVARKIGGCGGFEQLTRIPVTNHFHRQPVATLPLAHTSPILLGDYERAKENTSRPLVLSLPGPYSLAKQTKNVDEVGLNSLAEEYAQVLNQELVIVSLNQLPGLTIRIEEPLAPHDESKFPLFDLMMNWLTYGIDPSLLALTVSFGKIPNPEKFFRLPFGTFFVDFLSNSPEILKCFPKDKKLAAGVIDGRQTYDDPLKLTRELLRRIFVYVPPKRVALTTTSDLHFLPWDKALEKVRRVVRLARASREDILSRGKATRAIKIPVIVLSGTAKPNEKPAGKPVPYTLQSVPFPTSSVGSFPQSNLLRIARAQFKGGEIQKKEYRAVAEALAREWMQFQETVDTTFPVGGEFLRADMAAYFGAKFGGKVCGRVPSYENRSYEPIEYGAAVLPLGRSMLLEDFAFVQSLTRRPVKETITGPATLADWALIGNKRYYYNRVAFRIDLARALRKEIELLIRGGARVIQVDEPALTTNPQNLEADLEAIRQTVAGLETQAYFILHVCYSDAKDLDAAFPRILQLPFQQIHMEMAQRDYGLLRLIEEHGFGGKDIGLGVVDVHNVKDRIETVDEIVEGVRRVRPHFERNEQIWITPDCGLKERSDDVAKAKLRVMARAAERCREIF